jgi:AcrR family transcriptional regulator
MIRITERAKGLNRVRLLEAAAAEFAGHGLAGANINRISVAAGLAKGTVYNYFPSKEELFEAVVREACDLAVRRAGRSTAATTRERLLAMAAADVEVARENEAFARVMAREALSGDPISFQRIVSAAEPFISQVEQILRDGVERGEVRPDVPVSELALLFAGMDLLALTQHWSTAGAWPRLEDIPGLVVRQFLEGARGPASQEGKESQERN